MGKLSELGKLTKVDVLVIGGGIAGLFAAIKAKEKDPTINVTVVDKSCPGASGCSVFAAGVFAYCQEGDDFEIYEREIIEDNAEYLINQEYVSLVMKQSFDRFQDLLKWGVGFFKNHDGRVIRIQAMATKYGFSSPFDGGPNFMWKLRGQALSEGVTLIDRKMVVDLVVESGNCLGAVGFDVRTGEFEIFQSPATILASGSFNSNRAPMGTSGGTGDGQAIAFRAGIELRNMEQVGQTTIGPRNFSVPGLHVIFGTGGKLVNAKGERFMEKYNPILKERARRFETARAILREWAEGRGPCYLDCSHLPAESVQTIKTSLPLVIRSLAGKGLDIARHKIEYIPYPMQTLHVGGARIDNAAGRVPVNGLWVVGAASDFCGGAQDTVVTALSGCSVQGALAGEEAASFVPTKKPQMDVGQIEALKELTFKPLSVKGETKIDDAFYKILAAVAENINVLKNEEKLKIAIGQLEEAAHMVEKLGAKNPHELRKVHDVRNMAILAQVCAQSSLLRTESRVAHFRIDYPKRNDREWLKWITAKLVDGQIKLKTEDIPIWKWKYQPKDPEEVLS